MEVRDWLRGNLASGAIICLLASSLIGSVPVSSRASDDFEVRYEIALRHMLDREASLVKHPQRRVIDKIPDTLDAWRAKCGGVVDRRKSEITEIMIEWVDLTFETLRRRIARRMAKSMTFDELKLVSLVDPISPSFMEVIGEQRASELSHRIREIKEAMKREKWNILKRLSVPKLNAIDPCLGTNSDSITRS